MKLFNYTNNNPLLYVPHNQKNKNEMQFIKSISNQEEYQLAHSYDN